MSRHVDRVFVATPTPTEAEDGATETVNEEDLNENSEEEPTQSSNDEPGMWEETFKTHHDSKPYGMYIK